MRSPSGTRGSRADGMLFAISCNAVPGLATGDAACDFALTLYNDGVVASVYNCLLLSLFGMNFNGV